MGESAGSTATAVKAGFFPLIIERKKGRSGLSKELADLRVLREFGLSYST
jgi:hypothetical protein